ncbi:MAG: thioredoxin [Clostridia bacterium]|nr:thioredoxin [Clostridia bacterium]
MDTTPNTTTNKNVKITRLIILGIAVITLVLGAIFGGYADVLTKAVNICTECIGLG